MLDTALIVDDSPSARLALGAHLTDLGLTDVKYAVDGQAALEVLADQKNYFDVLFVDLHMPKMDGMLFLDKLGEMAYPGSVVIYSSMEQRVIDLAVELVRRQQVHLVGYLPKKLSSVVLEQVLERAESIKRFREVPFNQIKRRQLLTILERQLVLPYYQPQIDAKSGRLTGVEVLCRLQHPDTGEILTPDCFIPAMVKFGLINIMTMALLERALADMVSISQTLQLSDFRLSINVVPEQLDDDKLPTILTHFCEQHQIRPEQIIVELTESHVIETSRRLLNMNRLRMYGFGCSLDDYGTGFTNEHQLMTYPFTEVKLDRGFVSNIHNDLWSQTVLRRLHHAASAQHIAVVAEGVETEDERDFLQQYDNIQLQGYLIAKPMPHQQFQAWVAQWISQYNCEPHFSRIQHGLGMA